MVLITLLKLFFKTLLLFFYSKSDGPDDKDEEHEDDVEGNWQFVRVFNFCICAFHQLGSGLLQIRVFAL